MLAAGGISQSTDTITSEVALTRPHADAVGNGHLDTINGAAKSIKSNVPAINKALTDNEKLQADNQKMKADFWSTRQRALFTLALIVVSSVSVAFIILDFMAGMGNPVGVAAMVLFKGLATICTAGLNWIIPIIGKFNDWIGSKVRGWFGGKS